MPIDRTQYNTLVNDSGSNADGTLWTKEKVRDVLLDPIDALIGEKTDVTFAAGNFTANGSMTWTLTAGDQGNFWYQIHNKLMTVGFKLDTTTVGGVVSGELRITIPATKSCPVQTYNDAAFVSDNGTIREAYMLASGNTIVIARKDGGTWTASTNATYIYGSMQFPIS